MKVVITEKGASKEFKGGKHEFYAVGEEVTLKTECIPASLKGKCKVVSEPVKQAKSTAK